MAVQPPGPESPYPNQRLTELGLERSRIPRHVAVIMDGNGRWATSRGLPRVEGHRRGVATVRRTVRECSRLGVEQLTLYCLSSENWSRPEKELRLLLRLLKQFVVEERGELMQQSLRFTTIGRREGLTDSVLKEVDRTREMTADNTGMTLCLAVNYGSRTEIVDAIGRMLRAQAEGQLDAGDLSEAVVSSYLDTAGMPDPDLVLRTANERRLSNFLLWQVSYAELYVTPKFWPEFQNEDLHEAFRDFAARKRRFGGLDSDV